MKRKNAIQPSMLWYIASINDLESIKENGISNYWGGLKLIHTLQFGTFPLEECGLYSSADCLAIGEAEGLENLQYALIQISPEGLKNRLKRSHTMGEVISKCAYVSDINHIKPEFIVDIEIRTIDLDNLLCYNEWRTRNAMHSELIQSKKSGCGLDPKEIAQNNRILNERQSAIWFNNRLFKLLYGDYQSRSILNILREGASWMD